jgi:ribonucleotide reductase alpha subunit
MEEPQQKTISINDINVVKRDGNIVLFNIKKIYKMVELACEYTTCVSVSYISQGNISLPTTPIMANMGTTTRQFSSCLPIESDDTLKSIEGANSAVQEYVSKRANVGIGGTNNPSGALL